MADILPDLLEKDPVSGKIPSSKAIALLVIWSFLAGFSEKLVPTLLHKTESRFAQDKKS